MVIAIIGVAIMFFGVYKGISIPPKKQSTPAMHNEENHFDIQNEITAALKKLHPGTQEEVKNLAKVADEISDPIQKSGALERLAQKWIELKYPVIGAYYMSESGFLDNTEKKLNFASHLLNEGLHEEQDQEKRQWMAQTAIKCLEKVLEKNPDHVEAKMELANVYINGLGQPMQGVQQLLSIVEKDPKNLPANMVLTRMALESNQVDKALERGNNILKYYPKNWEVRILLAEAYNRTGDKQNAIKVLEEAKKLNKNQDFIKDVDQYLNLINQ